MNTSFHQRALRPWGLLVLLGLAFRPQLSPAAGSPAAPALMAFQGYLTDASGNPLGNTNTGPKAYDVVFRLWDLQSGGITNSADELYAEQQTVIVNNGYFSVQLGQGSQYANEPFQGSGLAGYFATNSSTGSTARYWETTVLGIGPNGANITIAPRLACLSAPYAFLAANAVNAVNLVNATGASLVSASGNTVNINGNLAAASLSGNMNGNGAGLSNVNVNAANVSGTLSIAQGGTGTSYQNFVDLASAQNIGGSKTFTGNVGIDTTANPNNPLTLYGPLTFTATSGGVPYVGMDYDPTTDALRLRANVGYTYLNNTWMTVKRQTGYIGVGTTTPGYPLEVDSYAYDPISVGAYYYLYTTTPETEYISSTLTEQVAIKANNWIVAQGFISPSDRRIKDIVGRSEPGNDLATIEKLQVTDYRMKDRVQNGNKLHKGFIAQEVKAVIPEAVSQSKGFVPDIYAVADRLQFDANTKDLRVVMARPHGLKAGDLVRLFTDDAATERTVTAVPDAVSFEVGDLAAAPKRVFVYGKQVDDFMEVDYNRIFTTGIGAIQQLAKRVETLEAREAQVTAWERKAARVDALEQKVADLQALVAQLAADRRNGRLAAQAGDPAPGNAEGTSRKSFTTASLAP